MPAGTWDLVDASDAPVRAGLDRMAARRRSELEAGARHTGWKVGFNDVNARAMLGLRTGVVGYLTDRTASVDGSVAIAGERYAAEVEVAFRLGARIRSNASDEEAFAAIAALHPAVEVVAFAELDVEDMLARDVWHHAYVLGPATPWGSRRARVAHRRRAAQRQRARHSASGPGEAGRRAGDVALRRERRRGDRWRAQRRRCHPERQPRDE